MTDRRPLFVLAGLIAVLAVILLVTRDSGSSSTENTATTIAQRSTTTVKQRATPTTQAPPLDWRAGLNRVIALQNELLKNPDPSRVDEVIDRSCACYDETKNGLQELKDRGWRAQGDVLKPSSVSLASQQGNEYRITVGLTGTGSPTVDGTGKVVQPGKTGELQPVLYVLQHKSGVWKVVERRLYEERQQ